MLLCSSFWKADSFRMLENLGLALPMGSEKTTVSTGPSYLKLGTGDPCAGQVREKARPWTMIRVNDFEMAENLGLALPIGSKRF